MRHLQGDLQIVFDALYDLGVIEPVLNQDWRSRLIEMENGSPQLETAIIVANECGKDKSRLTDRLSSMDRRSLEMLAMEVAREYAEFHTHAQQELH